MLLSVIILLERSVAYVIQNETVSESINETANSENSSSTDPKPAVVAPNYDKVSLLSAGFRPQPNMLLSRMQPRLNALSRQSLKRFSLFPLRGFFAFRSPLVGTDQVPQELGNASHMNCTNCQPRYLPRQISKRMAMAPVVGRTRRPYDVPQIGKSSL